MRPVSVMLSLLMLFVADVAAAKTIDGSDRSDRFIVSFGVLPAAMARDAIADHIEPSNTHGTPAPPLADTHHFVVALFDATTGKRITDAKVRARHVPQRGVASAKELVPMPLGETLSYGNTFVLPNGRGHRFEVEVRWRDTSESFIFIYDNEHDNE